MSRRQDLLNAVTAWVAGITGIEDAQLAVPKFFGAQVSVYVTLAGTGVVDDGGIKLESQDVLVGFGYSVEDQAAQAELTLAGFVDSFIDGYWAHRNAQDGPFAPSANGGWTVQAVPDGSRNSTPQYLDWSRAEVRHWVWIITLVQAR